MRTYWIWKGIKFLVLIALFATALTYGVMLLWNWLMPAIFGVGVLSFWEALGILVLAKILFGFGRWGGGHWSHKRHYYWKEKMEDRLKNMSPEQRDKFRAEWKQRCGGWKHYSLGEEKKVESEMKAD